MARNLEQLRAQYNSSSGNESLRGGPGAGRPGGGRGPGPRGMGGKPKNVWPTIKRILGYIGKYKILLLVVFLFMIVNTLTSLVGGYMTRPIINHLFDYVGEASESVQSSGG